MAELVNLTINGQPIQAEKGALLIEVSRQNGIEIPAFCYYEGLTLQAACRMCLVEVEKTPKLQVGCTLPVAEGMVVHTESETVRAARKGTLEFLLTNHPLDCPVCDKGGECELQDMVFRYGAGESRYTERKVHVDEQQWSPVVYFDAPRCILCYRCVRVCNEGMGVGALGVANRGVISEIVPNHHDYLECDECGACIDICPVGALTSGSYRYQTRPWEMTHVGTICTHCGDGCRTTLGVRDDKIMRGNNRDSSGINGEFLCIKGRYGFDFVEHPERLQSPMARTAGGFEPISWSKAFELIAAKFAEAHTRGGKFGVIGSNHTTNEENFFLQKFARQGLGTKNIDHHRTGDLAGLFDALSGRNDALAKTADLYTAKAVLVVGTDLAQQHPLLAYQARANVRHHNAHIYAVTTGPVREDNQAVASVRVPAGGELNGIESLRDKLKAEGDLVIVFGDSIQGDGVRKLVAFGDSLGIPVKYICLVDYSNSRGAFDMGVVPDVSPRDAGMSVQQMLAAQDLDVLWVVGANPLKNAALASRNAFVVVQDLFLSETAQRADIVLPAASAYEKNGTVTNVCGEVQKLKQAVKVMGTKTDLEIMGSIAKEMKLNLGIWLPDKVFEEIRKTVHGYNVPLPVVSTGGAAPTMPLNGRVAALPGLIQSAGDTLFTSGSLTRYSKILNAVIESPGGLYGGQTLNYYVLSLIKTGIVVGIFMHVLAYLQWIERKVIAHVQLRVGPRRVGPHGLLQPLADVIKLVTKEDILPSHVNKVFYFMAPFIAVTFALISISIIPFGPEVTVGGVRTPMGLTDLNIGVLFILGISGLGVYGVALAGWASNNKYALMGGLRSSAQMISYELPMALALVAPLLIINSLSLREIANGQEGFYWGFIPRWSIFMMPFPQIFSFILFLIAGFAETNRVPFDLPEAENELVAGFHVEYASMKFASFFMAEYANMVTVSCVATLLFLGGWHPIFPQQYGSGLIPVVIFAASAVLCFFHAANPARPFDRITLPVFGVLFLGAAGLFLLPPVQPILLPLFWFAAKVGVILFVFIWVRATLPRFRYDQLMHFAWTFMFPVALINLFITALLVALFP